MKKILIIIKNITKCMIFIFTIFLLSIIILGNKSKDGSINFCGYQTRIVLSKSMEKCVQTDISKYEIKDIPVKSMILIQTVPIDENKKKNFYNQIIPGDVLTFKYIYSKQETITHRVKSITPKDDGYYIVLEGDNNTEDGNNLIQEIYTNDSESFNYVIGKVKRVNPFLGRIVYIIKTPMGTICLIIIPCFFLIIWESVKIIMVFKNRNNDTEKKKIKAKENEIILLKKQLEVYEKSSQIKEKKI